MTGAKASGEYEQWPDVSPPMIWLTRHSPHW